MRDSSGRILFWNLCIHPPHLLSPQLFQSIFNYIVFSADYFSIVYRLPHFNNTSYYKADSSIHPHPDSDLQTLQWLLLLFLLDRIADILCLLGGEYFIGLLWNSHFFCNDYLSFQELFEVCTIQKPIYYVLSHQIFMKVIIIGTEFFFRANISNSMLNAWILHL